MQKIKNKARKDQAENLFDWEQKDFGGGTYLDPPASEIPDNSLVRADDCKVYPGWIEGRTGTKLWGTALLPTLPDRDNYIATKSGYIITKTQGQGFTVDDVDNYFIWPDGTHEQIAEFLTATTVRVRSADAHSPATAANPGSIRGPINCIHFHSTKRLIIMQIDTRFFYSTIAVTAWTEIYLKSMDAPISDVSVMSEFGDFVFVFNSNGIFKIDIGLTIPEAFKANATIPENTITEVTESQARPYVRRYLYAMSKLGGVGNRDRTTANTEIKLESGTPAADPDNDFQDFRAVANTVPFGTDYGEYQVLTCDATTRTFAEWTASHPSAPAFDLDVNGTVRTVVSSTSQFTSATSWEDLANVMQANIRNVFSDIAPYATCEWDADHFVLTAGKEAGTNIGYLDNAPGIYTDIGDDTFLNGRDPAAGGNGILSTQTTDSVTGPLTVPAGEQQWTHYSVYATKDVGSEYGSLNDPNAYIWVADVPVIKSFTAARDILGNIVSGTGIFEECDVGAEIVFSDGTTDTIETYVGPNQVTGTPGVVANQGAAIGATDVATASQAGHIVTRTAGQIFTANEVGKTLFWADGYSVYVTEFIDNDHVRVAENENHPLQGLAWDPVSRSFSDTITDDVLENRYHDFLLQQRFWKELPIINTGIVVPGFMFCALRNNNKIYYSQMSLGYEYLAGYYNPAFQYETLDDSLTHFSHFPDMCVLYCATSTKRISINISNSKTVPGTLAVVTNISGVTSVDSEIGCLDFGSIRNIDIGRQILVTSEPGVRVFDGYRYSENLAIDEKGNGHMMNSLRELQAATASSYDPNEGYILWGTDQALD